MFFTMKKLLFLLAFLMAMATAGAQNASNEKCFFDKIVINLGVSAGTGCNNMHPLTLNADIGYRFIPRMYAFVHGESIYGHCDADGLKTYVTSQNLGGGLGYTFYKDGVTAIDLRGTVSTSVGHADWKNVAYDLGVMFRVGRGPLKFDFGVSFRHMSSRTAGIGSYNGAFFTLGVGI